MNSLEVAKQGFVFAGSICIAIGVTSSDEGVTGLILALVGLGFGLAAWGVSKLQMRELSNER